MEEVAKYAELFEESVKTYPETIACRNQNQPLGRFYWPDDNKWDMPSVEKYKMGIKKIKMLSGYESKCYERKVFFEKNVGLHQDHSVGSNSHTDILISDLINFVDKVINNFLSVHRQVCFSRYN